MAFQHLTNRSWDQCDKLKHLFQTESFQTACWFMGWIPTTPASLLRQRDPTGADQPPVTVSDGARTEPRPCGFRISFWLRHYGPAFSEDHVSKHRWPIFWFAVETRVAGRIRSASFGGPRGVDWNTGRASVGWFGGVRQCQE